MQQNKDWWKRNNYLQVLVLLTAMLLSLAKLLHPLLDAAELPEAVLLSHLCHL